MNRPAPTIPPNRIAAEIYIDDVLEAIRDRLALIAAIDIERINERARGYALSLLVDELDTAIAFHLANRTPWAHPTDTTGADHD